MGIPRRSRSTWLAAALIILGWACDRAAVPPVDPAYIAEIESWRGERLARLTAEDGYLTLVGLFWLEEGANHFGSGPSNEIVLPGDDIPESAGSLQLDSTGVVRVQPEPGSEITVGGETVDDGRLLSSDAEGSPDILHLGRLRMYLIDRGGRLALRVKDPDSQTRRDFRGVETFPIDPGLRVEARLEPFAEPRRVSVATVVGTSEEMLAPGLLHFELSGRELSLLPLVSSPDDERLFIVFRDATSGRETYGAARFLTAHRDDDDSVVLDFNRAVNPPCAFTPFATCPLPPAENVLPVRIEAGEKIYSAH